MHKKGPLRYGIIGCGDMAGTHARNIVLRPDLFRVVAMCDIDGGRMDKVQEKLGPAAPAAKRYGGYRALLDDPAVEAVIVSTPNDYHAEPAIAAMQSGRAVFCEKPFATSLADCDRMIAARDASGVVLQIGLVLRYSLVFQKMAEVIREGRIGQPLMAWCQEFRAPFPIGNRREWRYDTARSGGAILEKNCHHFDLFEWLLGARTARVQAFGGNAVVMKGKVGAAVPFMKQFDDLVGRNDIVDHAVVNLAYANGAKASLLLCFFAPNNGLPFGVLGSRGRMEVNVNRQLEGFILHENSKTFDYPEGSRGEFIAARENQVGEGFIVHPGGLRQHKSFYEAVRKNKPVLCTAEIGRQSVAVALAAEKSILLEGTPVDAAAFLKVENNPGPKSTRRRKSRS